MEGWTVLNVRIMFETTAFPISTRRAVNFKNIYTRFKRVLCDTRTCVRQWERKPSTLDTTNTRVECSTTSASKINTFTPTIRYLCHNRVELASWIKRWKHFICSHQNRNFIQSVCSKSSICLFIFAINNVSATWVDRFLKRSSFALQALCCHGDKGVPQCHFCATNYVCPCRYLV